jgi:RHS repeat-associated protein
MYWFGNLLDGQRDASGLQYMRNRYYDPVSGRFTQEDPIGLAGGMNLYGFAAGDPVSYSDPFGLCPEKAADGTVCIDYFISSEWAWGFRGDGRGHDAEAGADQSRAQIIITPGDREGSYYTVNSSCNFLYCSAPRSDNKVSLVASEAKDGSFAVTFNLKDAAAPFGAAPDLNGTVVFISDGKGGYTTAGNVSAYPSSDIYQRRDGQWQLIRRHDETSPRDLFDAAKHDKWPED